MHISFNEISEEFRKCGFKVLTTYKEFDKPYTTKIKYRCPEGHEGKVVWYNWKISKKCKKCSYNRSRAETTESIKLMFKSEGYTLLSEYKNNRSKLYYICPTGHEHHTYINNWKKGCRCGYCTGKYKLYEPDVIKAIKNEDYRIITKYIKDSKQKIHTICPKGHDYFVTWDAWKSSFSRCSKCQISVGERDLKKYVDSLNIKYISNDRSIITSPLTGYKLELDLWFPQFNKAIEYNGEYWHLKESAVNRDKIKRKICDRLNIDLLTIWESNWINNRKECKNKIKDFLEE